MYWVVQTTKTIGKQSDPSDLFDDFDDVKVIKDLKTLPEAKAAWNEVYKDAIKDEGGYNIDFNEDILKEVEVKPLGGNKIVTISIVEQV